MAVIPRRNEKQRLCKIWGGKEGALWEIRKWRIYRNFTKQSIGILYCNNSPSSEILTPVQLPPTAVEFPSNNVLTRSSYTCGNASKVAITNLIVNAVTGEEVLD